MGATEARSAAAVILVRERETDGVVEVYLQRRTRTATFMSSASVFPGGAADPGETDPRWTAIRELFEEAGVLITEAPVATGTLAELRREVAAGRSFDELVQEHRIVPDPDALDYAAHWITPTIEPKRFSARFYLAALPPGQSPTVDHREAVEDLWVTPSDALERRGELRLPPPQLRTLFELAADEQGGIAHLRSSVTARANPPAPILPRALESGPPFTLLFPWDRAYDTALGEGAPFPADHPTAFGPSRVTLTDDGWQLSNAPEEE